jgi:hypothetical protein
MRGSSLGKVAFSAAVVFAFGFGAREAVSKPVTPADRRIACTTDEECQSYCEIKYHTTDVRGICEGHCICLF